MIIIYDIHMLYTSGLTSILFSVLILPHVIIQQRSNQALFSLNTEVDTNCSNLILLNGSKPSRLHDYLLKMYPKSVTGISSSFSTQTIG